MNKKTYHRVVEQYPVVVHEDVSGGFWVTCPILEGCYSQGETIDEALKNIREAIALSLEDLPPRKKTRMQKQHVSLHFVPV